jgi:hypothetical protein
LEIRGSKLRRRRAKEYAEGVLAQRTGPISIATDYDDDDLPMLRVPQEAAGSWRGESRQFLKHH